MQLEGLNSQNQMVRDFQKNDQFEKKSNIPPK